MLKSKQFFLSIALFFVHQSLSPLSISIKQQTKTSAGIILLIKFNLELGESLFKDSLRFSTDSELINCTPRGKTKQETVQLHISGIKNGKRVYSEPFIMAVQLNKVNKKKKNAKPFNLHISGFVHKGGITKPVITMLGIKNKINKTT